MKRIIYIRRRYFPSRNTALVVRLHSHKRRSNEAQLKSLSAGDHPLTGRNDEMLRKFVYRDDIVDNIVCQ